MNDYDKCHIHEALDRCHVICANIDDHLLSHPAIKHNHEIREKILNGQSLIASAYQDLGALTVDDEPVVKADACDCSMLEFTVCPHHHGNNTCQLKR